MAVAAECPGEHCWHPLCFSGTEERGNQTETDRAGEASISEEGRRGQEGKGHAREGSVKEPEEAEDKVTVPTAKVTSEAGKET